ncbi:unnamed protein product [Peniophora sp. CBMAI 1063]|nr:unnamed protein product [Peniophora sp. CBMAI 1063]
MLLFVLLTSFVRQSWNLGVAFLCFWLFIENLIYAVNAIIWFDNADVKLYAYCDLVTRVLIVTFVVKPMATLIITRRLYLITSRQSVRPPSKAIGRRDCAIEWTLGLVIPILVAGPLYYVVQWLRFEVDAGYGCRNAPEPSGLTILLLLSWAVVPPLVSVLVYYPHVARIFYHQHQDVNRFLRSDGPDSVSRASFFRILALASIDTLFTLPVGIASITLSVTAAIAQDSFPFYFGWARSHTDWEPASFTQADIASVGTSSVVEHYFTQWTSPVLAFVIFGLFGFTSEARTSYWKIVCAICGWFGWKSVSRARSGPDSSLGSIEFGARAPQGSVSFGLGSQPGIVISNAHAREIAIEGRGENGMGEVKGGSLNEAVVEVALQVQKDRSCVTRPEEDRENAEAEAPAVDATSAV